MKMAPALAWSGVLIMAMTAMAEARPDSLKMSCGQARALVARQGGIVIGSGPNIYDRFVVDHQFCYPTQYLKPAWIPAADTPNCPIGYRCVEDPPWAW
jgi:hypothetical protein